MKPLAGVILVAALCGSMRYSLAEPVVRPAALPETIPPHGGTYLTTLPPGAAVWLDGAYVGQTPLYVQLPPGHHDVTVTRTGMAPQSAGFDVAIGRVEPLSIVLQKLGAPKNPRTSAAQSQGTLSVRGGPNGASVFVDAMRAGIIPMEARKERAGNHIVIVGTDRSTRIIRDVDVFPATASVLLLNSGPATAANAQSLDDMLAPVNRYLPASNVNTFGQEIIIHSRGMELQCQIGSHAYMLNGRAGVVAVPPTMLGGKLYLPLSLLNRIVRK